jgi:hypothetical protein
VSEDFPLNSDFTTSSDGAELIKTKDVDPDVKNRVTVFSIEDDTENYFEAVQPAENDAFELTVGLKLRRSLDVNVKPIHTFFLVATNTNEVRTYSVISAQHF